MKIVNLLLRIVMLLFITYSVQSCSVDDNFNPDKDNTYDVIVADWATVRYMDNAYYIDSDEYGLFRLCFNIVHTSDKENILEASKADKDGQRILATFGLNNEQYLSQEENETTLYLVEKILTKPTIFVTAEMEDSIGNDPASIQKMWLSKEHLNIEYSYKYSDIGIPHMLNLVVKEENVLDANGLLEVEFRHNRNGDGFRLDGSGSVSFEMNSISAFEEGKLKGLRVIWTLEEGKQRNYIVRFEDGITKQAITASE